MLRMIRYYRTLVLYSQTSTKKSKATIVKDPVMAECDSKICNGGCENIPGQTLNYRSISSYDILCSRKNSVVNQVANFSRGFVTYKNNSIIIRRATLSDYDAVMRIRDPEKLFDGYDSLPDIFNMLLECPTNAGYVAIINDKVVGFQLGIFTNDYQAVSLYGLRVGEEYEGLRITNLLVNNIVYESQYNIPSRWGTCVDTKTKEKHLANSFLQSVDLSIKMAIFPYISTKSITSQFLKTYYRISKSTHLVDADLRQVFNSDVLCHELFPGGRITKSWNLYQPIPENIPLLMDSRTEIVGSNLSDAKQALVSFGTYAHTFKGLLYNMIVFGNADKCLDEHLFLHVKAASVHATTDITFEITVGEDIQDRYVKTTPLMREFGFQEPSYYGNHGVYCYEGNTKDLRFLGCYVYVIYLLYWKSTSAIV